MNNLLLSLGSGVGLIVLIGALLSTRMDPRQAATAVAVAAVGVYLPLAAVYWPGLDVVAMHLAVYLVACYAFAIIAGSLRRSGGRRFHWGPAAIVGFFAVLLAVDSVFILLAERGLPGALARYVLPATRGPAEEMTFAFPGVVTEDYRERGIRFASYRQRLQRQQERGWQVRKGWLRRPVLGEPAVFKVVATTRTGEPLRDAEVQGVFIRPSNSRLDVAFRMQEIEPGQYQTVLELPAAGAWNLVLTLRQDEELHEIRASTSVLAQRGR